MKMLTSQNVKEILEMHRNQQPLPEDIGDYKIAVRFMEYGSMKYNGYPTMEEAEAACAQIYGRYEASHVFDLTYVEWEGDNVYFADITRMIDY